jgi:hypothetical protein
MLESLKKEAGEDKIEEEKSELQKLFKEYKEAGGGCPNAEAFVKDIVGFVRFKDFTGADIAKWDKEYGPESE